MVVLVVFDVSDDRLRLQVCNACQDHGLVRVQRSAFRGELDVQRRHRLEADLVRLSQGAQGCDIQIYPLCQEDFRSHARYTDGESVADDVSTPDALVF